MAGDGTRTVGWLAPAAWRSCRHLLLVDEAQEDGLEIERLLRRC